MVEVVERNLPDPSFISLGIGTGNGQCGELQVHLIDTRGRNRGILGKIPRDALEVARMAAGGVVTSAGCLLLKHFFLDFRPTAHVLFRFFSREV